MTLFAAGRHSSARDLEDALRRRQKVFPDQHYAFIDERKPQ
ncbi:MAG: hypothetical protein U5J83_08740 [Bryobacterales bacterium]|nr:hypothetical protein [Bryobacterales bacterium]